MCFPEHPDDPPHNSKGNDDPGREAQNTVDRPENFSSGLSNSWISSLSIAMDVS